MFGKQQPILNTGVKEKLVERFSQLASPTNCLSISLGGTGGMGSMIMTAQVNQISDLTSSIPQVPPVDSYLIKIICTYCVVAGLAYVIYEFGTNVPFIIESIL